MTPSATATNQYRNLPTTHLYNDEYMQMCEDAGWRWANSILPVGSNEYERTEDIETTTKRHPSLIKFEAAVNELARSVVSLSAVSAY